MLLTLAFGPLGLFYSSGAGAIAMIIAAIVFGTFAFGLALIVIWPLTVLIGIATVSSFNEKIDMDTRRHEELVRAVAGLSQPKGSNPSQNTPKPPEPAFSQLSGFFKLW